MTGKAKKSPVLSVHQQLTHNKALTLVDCTHASCPRGLPCQHVNCQLTLCLFAPHTHKQCVVKLCQQGKGECVCVCVLPWELWWSHTFVPCLLLLLLKLQQIRCDFLPHLWSRGFSSHPRCFLRKWCDINDAFDKWFLTFYSLLIGSLWTLCLGRNPPFPLP